jgi:hypothetical protein
MALSGAAVNGLRTAFEKAERAGASLDQFLQRVRELVFPHPDKPAAATPAASPTEPRPVPRTETASLAVPTPSSPHGPADLELVDLVLKAVREVGVGVPISVAELRRQMPSEFREKATFDRVVWGLIKEDKLDPVPHNYPAGLTDAERAELLTNAEGDFYAYVAQRS